MPSGIDLFTEEGREREKQREREASLGYQQGQVAVRYKEGATEQRERNHSTDQKEPVRKPEHIHTGDRNM